MRRRTTAAAIAAGCALILNTAAPASAATGKVDVWPVNAGPGVVLTFTNPVRGCYEITPARRVANVTDSTVIVHLQSGCKGTAHLVQPRAATPTLLPLTAYNSFYVVDYLLP